MQMVLGMPLMGAGADLQNWQPPPSQAASMVALMRRAQQQPMDWSLFQNRQPFGWPEPKPLDERFADFKARLAAARAVSHL